MKKFVFFFYFSSTDHSPYRTFSSFSKYQMFALLLLSQPYTSQHSLTITYTILTSIKHHVFLRHILPILIRRLVFLPSTEFCTLPVHVSIHRIIFQSNFDIDYRQMLSKHIQQGLYKFNMNLKSKIIYSTSKRHIMG